VIRKLVWRLLQSRFAQSSLDFARDFGARLGRRACASTSLAQKRRSFRMTRFNL